MQSDLQPFLAVVTALFVMISLVQGFLSPKDSTVCFNEDEVKYIACSDETDNGPSVCDCEDKAECYVKLEITGGFGAFSINGGRFGPSIIVSHEAILAVDIINTSGEKTSIHWHGMHQRNVPWMDGVASVTQYAIPRKHGKFRYIFRAHPSGTHWYHSHVREQRDQGIVGALIVKEKEGILEQLSDYPPLMGEKIEDVPEQHTLSVTERMKEGDANCMLDNSRLPERNRDIGSFLINGVRLQKTVREEIDQGLYYTVEPGENYRFRVIGAMKESVFRISIDGHRLIVVSTDSYLTKPFEADVVHVHVGERYDFVVKTRADVESGAIFPIRIESVAVYCNNHSQPAAVGIAYLVYGYGVFLHEGERCTIDCIALNCPFQNYPEDYYPSYHCIDVYDALSLLVPTPKYKLPDEAQEERFFDFIFNPSPTVNSVKNILPIIPFAMTSEEVPGECNYDEILSCPPSGCPHAVYVNQNHGLNSIDFVFSSVLKTDSDKHITDLGTHPIHMHGHSFWVAKIAYPTYSEDGTIESVNDDIEVPDCGHGNWRFGSPDGILVNETTIRKDVITVPAGGYVVIRFRVTNPGWWIMHCHIDPHLVGGMAIAVGEESDCQNPPPDGMKNPFNEEFCWSVDEFIEKELFECPEIPEGGASLA